VPDNLWRLRSIANSKSEDWVISHNDKLAMQYALDRIEELTDVLTSAHCIAKRNGVDTAWERFSERIGRLGIGSVTAKVFKVLPSDLEEKEINP